MLNTDAYNRLIAHVAETDTITAIAIHALLNKALEQSPASDYAEWGQQPELLTLISADEWEQAREDLDSLRYAEIDLSVALSYKDMDDEDLSNEVQRVQAYLPRGWIATLVTKSLEDEGFKRVIAITGHERMGWTLDDYVLPRLASGNIFAKVVAA
jgi:hypothetical protein